MIVVAARTEAMATSAAQWRLARHVLITEVLRKPHERI
jgi:hypothetical protein